MFHLVDGHTYNKLSGLLDVSQHTIEHVCKQFYTRDHETRRQNCGRKDILTEGDMFHDFDSKSHSKPTETAAVIDKDLSEPVCERKLQRKENSNEYLELDISQEDTASQRHLKQRICSELKIR